MKCVCAEWISVKYELPKHKKPFLGTDGKIIFSAYWSNFHECYCCGGWELCGECGGYNLISFKEKPNESQSYKLVTHWMPLPRLPEVNDEKN